MHCPPVPNNEVERLGALERYGLLDTAQDPAYDAFTRLAAEICGTQVSLVSLIDSSRQWFKSNVGFPDVSETPRDVAFCTHAMATDEFFQVEDATTDPRFLDNPLVTGDPSIRFYAGVPLVDRDGFALGTLCTFDSRPHTLTSVQRGALQRLATSLVALIESRLDVPDRSLEQQASFNAAYEFAADPIAVLRAGGNRVTQTITYVNRAFADLFGHDQTDLIGHQLRTLEGPKTDQFKMARLRAAADAAEPGTESTFLYASTGVARFVELRERVVDQSHRILSVRDLTRVQATQEALSDANERLKSLLANNSDSVLTVDSRGACIDANPAACDTFSLERVQFLGFGFSRIAPEGIFPDREPMPESLSNGYTMEFHRTYRTIDGTPIEIECKAIPMIVRGESKGAYLILKDVTEAKRLEALVKEQADRTRALYLISASASGANSDPIDKALRLVLDTLSMEYGFVGELAGDAILLRNVVGHGIREVGELIPLSETRVAETIARGDVLVIDDISTDRQEHANVRDYKEYRAYVSAPLFIDGKPVGAIGFLAKHLMRFDEFDRDFVRLVAALVASSLERQRQRRRLDELAFYDGLTRLPNRLKFMDALKVARSRVERNGGAFALHFIDLDGFKAVNDRFGHAVGDEVLFEVGSRLRDVHRPGDVPARFGGDEFVLLEHDVASPADATALGDRIVASLSLPIVTSAGPMRIGASVGIALYPNDAESTEKLLHVADAALYCAKAAGKSRAVLYAAPEVMPA